MYPGLPINCALEQTGTPNLAKISSLAWGEFPQKAIKSNERNTAKKKKSPSQLLEGVMLLPVFEPAVSCCLPRYQSSSKPETRTFSG